VFTAVDLASTGTGQSLSADFTAFGPRGEAIVGKDARSLVANTRGRADYIPPDLQSIVGKAFGVVVTLKDRSLDVDDLFFMVQAAEPIIDHRGVLQSNELPISAEDLLKEQTIPAVPNLPDAPYGSTVVPPPVDTTPVSDVASDITDTPPPTNITVSDEIASSSVVAEVWMLA
jgi:hypothetical protein